MYMDVLEQEVEALSAEVTRLRLMVHRVTQVMEAPLPSRHGHVDPMPTAHSTHPRNVNAPENLQATVDSYKQILPLVQLLLEQQQQQQRSQDASANHHGSRSKAKSSRRSHHHHRHRSRQPPSSTATSSTTRSSSYSSSRGSNGDQPSSSATSTSHVAVTPTQPIRNATPSVEGPPSATTSAADRPALSWSSPEAQRPSPVTRQLQQSAVAREETPTPAKQRGLPLATPSKSGSVVDRLRAQRGLTAREDSDASTDSSGVLPMFASQIRTAATSPSASAQRTQREVAAAATTTTTTTATTHASKGAAANPIRGDASLSHLSHAKPSRSLISSKLFDAPLAHAGRPGSAAHPMDSLRSTSIPAEDMGYYEFSPMLSVLDASHEHVDAAAASAHRGRSAANSLEHSEQGRYDYSVLGSLANSPAMSHMPDDAMQSARTGTTTAASAALDLTPGVRATTTTAKQLPQQMNVMSRLRELSSGSSSSSDDDAVARTPVVLAGSSAANRPFASGVVLGARRPISAHTPNHSAGPSAFPALDRAVPPKAAGTNLLATLRSLKSSGSSSDSTSSSDGVAAAFHHRPQARQAAKVDHRESSFHNYSDAAASPPVLHVAVPSPTPGSQDARSHAAYAGHHSARSSPKRGAAAAEKDASAEFSRALSHSVSRPQTAHSESQAASSVGRRGSMASGGYYYGYDFGMGSPSQQSMVSNGGVERGTPSSSPGYDY